MNEPKLKSAREWMAEMSGLEEPALLTVNRSAIRDIQLEAIKYGMRLAAVIVRTEEMRRAGMSLMTPMETDMTKMILTAAENMNEVPK